MKLTLTDSDKERLKLSGFVVFLFAAYLGAGHIHSFLTERTEQARPSIQLAHPEARQPFHHRTPVKPLQIDLRSEYDKEMDLYLSYYTR